MEWVSANTPPSKDGEYLVLEADGDGENYKLCSFFKGEWWDDSIVLHDSYNPSIDDAYLVKGITHWAEMPPKPKKLDIGGYKSLIVAMLTYVDVYGCYREIDTLPSVWFGEEMNGYDVALGQEQLKMLDQIWEEAKNGK